MGHQHILLNLIKTRLLHHKGVKQASEKAAAGQGFLISVQEEDDGKQEITQQQYMTVGIKQKRLVWLL